MAKRMVPEVRGARCKLRLLEETDLPTTLSWRNQDEIRCWFVSSDKLTLEQHAGWFGKYRERDDDFVFVIEETRSLQRPVGQISLYKVDWSAGTAEYGRVLIGDPDARGLGVAREATQLLVGLGFGTWGLRRIHLEVYKSNERAIAVYLANGFQIAGETETMLRMEIVSEAVRAVA